MPNTRQGYRPCAVCGHFASEWREIDGTNYAVTAPRGVNVDKGEEWTCKICADQGHEQRAGVGVDKELSLVSDTEANG